MYLARYGDHVDALAPDGTVRVVARGFDRPHGITLAPDGSLYVADTYAGAVRRVREGRTEAVATGLAVPTEVALDRDGSVLVTELQGGRLVRIRDGRKTVVAGGLSQPAGIAVTAAAIYVGELGRGDVVAIGADGRARRVSR